MDGNFRQINYRVMTDTLRLCESDPILANAVQSSLSHEKIYWGNVPINAPVSKAEQSKPKIAVVSADTLSAAARYQGRKIAILDFASGYTAGGSPFSAGTQEECLCRSTTLYPCLLSKKQEFYQKHHDDSDAGLLDGYGNDDAIFVPDVVVFKDSDSEPKLLSPDRWFKVDVIAIAAPHLRDSDVYSAERLNLAFRARIARIFDIARAEKDKILILGAFGCGAFHNPPELVAGIMKEYAEQSDAEIIDFAIMSWKNDDPNLLAFKKVIGGE
jgi:uncharacterized protein (TIGR02452 family)